MASLGVAWSLFIGIYLLKGKKEVSNAENIDSWETNNFPKFSLIIPAKNEQKTLERLLKLLTNLDYPDYEIIIVEGNSHDKTSEICEKFQLKYPDLIKTLKEKKDKGKPSALNLALKGATGEIVGVLDADSIPTEKIFLKKIANIFEKKNISAVQGKISLISPKSGLASRLSNFSRYLPLPYLIKGKKRVGGFIPLFGTHQYVKKSVLEKIGGWNEEALTEDIDLSLELYKRNLKIEYSLVEVLEEPPASFKSFIDQNIRHSRGMIQSLFDHLSDLNFSKLKGWDALLTLSAPLIVSLGLIGFLIITFVLPFLLKNEMVIAIVALIASSLSLAMVKSRYSNDSKLSHAPWIFLLWLVQSGIGISSFIAEILNLPRPWKRTEKKISRSV